VLQIQSWLHDRATLGDLAERSGYALPPASWSLLEHLNTNGSMRVSDVAACHGVHTSSIVPRLKALESTGLIARGAEPDDARVSMICITDTGRCALESMHAARQEAFARALLGIDAESIEAAADALCSLADRLPGGGGRELQRSEGQR
jgi:DNA-binding MarR family transcriptional regulator